MIDSQIMYHQKAVRLSLNKVAATVTNVEPGQLFQLSDIGEWEYADGTKKAYPTLNSRYSGTGLGLQGELHEGRDDVSRSGMITCLKGNFEIGTTFYDTTKTFHAGQPLHPSTVAGDKGKLVPFDSTNVAHKTYYIAGFVTHVPTSNTDFLRYEA